MTKRVPSETGLRKAIPEVPKTEAAIVRKFKEILGSEGGPNKMRLRKTGSHDWLALFVEWLHTDVNTHTNISHFLESKNIHRGSIQKRAGRMFWNLARENVRVEAMSRAIKNAPDVVARKFDLELRTAETLAKIVLKKSEKLLAAADKSKSVKESLKELCESIKILADANMRFAGNPGESQNAPSVKLDLHVAMVQAVNERDQQLGVVDAGSEA